MTAGLGSEGHGPSRHHRAGAAWRRSSREWGDRH